MDQYLLAIPLPLPVRLRLASLCYGLPQVDWIEEENFLFTLRFFGPLNDQTAAQIEERLSSLFFLKFNLALKGVDHFHSSKGNRGIIWVGVEQTPELLALRKEIHDLLIDLHLKAEERPYHPHITIGKYHRLNEQRLAEYLMAHAHFQMEPIETLSCQLLSAHQTPKHTYYKIIKQIDASSPATFED